MTADVQEPKNIIFVSIPNIQQAPRLGKAFAIIWISLGILFKVVEEEVSGQVERLTKAHVGKGTTFPLPPPTAKVYTKTITCENNSDVKNMRAN